MTEHPYNLLSDEEARAALERDWRADPTLSGAELGRKYGRTPEWGRKRVRILKQNGGEVVPIRSTPTLANVGQPQRVVPEPKPSPRMQAPARHPGPVRVPPVAYWATLLGVVAVALITAAASYVHMQDLTEANNQGRMSYWLPAAVDGMMLVATMTLLVRRERSQPVRLAWTCLALGVALSITANVASAYTLPGWTQGAISAWPPLLLLLAIHLLIQLRNTPEGTKT